MLRKITFAILTLVLLLFAACGERDALRDIKIEGPPHFQEDVREALALLRDKAPEYYDLVSQEVNGVWLMERSPFPQSGIWGTNKNNVCFSRSTYATLSFYHIPGCLVHEAVHFAQDPNMDMEERERQAVAVQRDVLHKIGAPPQVIAEIGDHIWKTRWWEDEPNQ